MSKQVSSFAMPRGAKEPTAESDAPPGPDMDDPRMMRAMSEMEREMEHLDENNPKHMAHLMRKMKDMMPGDAMPKEFETAIKRLEAGEDPEKIEEDMGDIFGGMEEGEGGGAPGASPYTRDSGLYDY
jgi:hypothetical protein